MTSPEEKRSSITVRTVLRLRPNQNSNPNVNLNLEPKPFSDVSSSSFTSETVQVFSQLRCRVFLLQLRAHFLHFLGQRGKTRLQGRCFHSLSTAFILQCRKKNTESSYYNKSSANVTVLLGFVLTCRSLPFPGRALFRARWSRRVGVSSALPSTVSKLELLPCSTRAGRQGALMASSNFLTNLKRVLREESISTAMASRTVP